MKQKILPPALPILGVFFLDSLSFVIVLPIFAHLILDSSFIDPAFTTFERFLTLGALLASFPLAQLLGAPLFGELADHKSKKHVFIYTLIGISFGYFLTALSLEFDLLYLLFLGRFVTGFFSANRAICLSALNDQFKNNHSLKIKNFGRITAIEGVSFTIAIPLGGWLSDKNLDQYFSVSLPIWIALIFSLINLIFLITVYQEPKHGKTPPLKLKRSCHEFIQVIQTKGVKPVIFTHFFLVLSWFTTLQFNSAFLIVKFSESNFAITTTYLFIGIFWGISSWFFYSKISKKTSHRRILKTGFSLLTTLLFACFFNPNFLIYGFLLILCSSISSILWPASLYLAAELKKGKVQGKIQGLYQSVKSLALILGPISMSYLIDLNINYLHLFTATSSLIGFFIVFIYLKGRPPEKQTL